MSWPKAFVRWNGTVRIAEVWGLYVRGSGAIVNGVPADMPELAVSIDRPDGKPPEYPNPRYKSFILPITEVLSINWECLENFKDRVAAKWWTAHGVECFADGYGADVKQADLDKQMKT